MTAALACLVGHAQAQHAPENQLKAALIYNFVLFTEWPRASLPDGDPLILCVAKNTVVTEALGQLEQKPIAGHAVKIKAWSENDDWQACKVVYIENDERFRLPQIRKKLEGLSVLIISDKPGAIDEGAMIAIAVENNRFIFDINASAAHQARLNISSKLLRLARKVL
ncbi:MAG: YfiR family protein [Pseudomonadota bacterium]